ncbi:hypothetical protein IV38_GL001719 [Lactobacillus selangorensis]|uniref:Uncharacterized protein n=1 Tax=Lactobacillus selangorensis TaxID=81857 RepID=A0A0R2FQ38_9LACO|nr:hypothetical protein [Lactobacillus selangorensis]KRN27880.1 hypothetical protein IV38_GL001719 [Lactobacillus selangorensis]KRN30649.1 hypothetical protein IV40_GL001836 [Lactobacillus selangorensis]
MATENKKGAFSMDAALFKQVSDYCELSALETDELIEQAVRSYLQPRQQQLEEFAQGYVDMAQLNREIAQEFSQCESEAYALI